MFRLRPLPVLVLLALAALLLSCGQGTGRSDKAEAGPASPVLTIVFTANTYGEYAPCPA